MAHPNVERTQLAYDSFAKGDLETLMGMMTDDIVWHLPGDNPLSGDYHGKREVLELFGRLNEMAKGTFVAEPAEIVANDHFAATLLHSSVEREGASLDRMPEVHVARYRDGMLCEFWGHTYDLDRFDEVWSA